MADRKQNDSLSQYKYAAMSNLVLQADRRFVSRRNDESTGDPESLAGRINIRDMGSRSARQDAPVQKKKRKGPAEIERGNIREGEDLLRELRKRKRDEPRAAGVLQQDFSLEGLRYRPRTPATRQIYELISTIIRRALGDVPNDVVRSAVDLALEHLKNEDFKDVDKKNQIEEDLTISMNPKEFNELMNLGKKITDYDAQDDDENVGGNAADAEEMDLDDRQGVAVGFDEDDEDEETAGQTFEVRDEDTSDEEPNDMDGDGLIRPADSGDDEGSETQDATDKDGDLVLGRGPNGAAQQKEDKPTVSVHEIDAYWLLRQFGQIYEDAHTQQEKTQDALTILSGVTDEGEEIPLREIENSLLELVDYEHPELVAKLIINRDKIVWVTKWQRAEGQDAKTVVEREMALHAPSVLKELRTRDDGAKGSSAPSKGMKLDLMDIDVSTAPKDTEMADKPPERALVGGLMPRRLINLENLVFEQGSHLNTNPRVKLPQGSTKRQMKGYEEIHVPAPKAKKDPNAPPNRPISELPEWARAAFGSTKELNAIQSRVFPSAFGSESSLLIAAPTGSGKTNVAMLCILKCIENFRNPETGELALPDFKIVYISPLKALVAEQVGNFGKRLEPYGIRVSELTGDRQLTKSQIADTQIIVTTPEKWDVITRKATDTSYTNLVRLIIIDEIHLLHDDRGPVLESIVSRTIRRTEQTGDPVRLVGLSATLPNYRDVAAFLRVDPENTFYFDSSYRPCPLKQEFIGVNQKSAIKSLKLQNEICYNKVLENMERRNQMLIFVHSRKDTGKTGKYIRDKALEMETIGQILRSDAASRQILKEAADDVSNADLKDLLPYGFGIHHAGLSRSDRTTVEDLFSDGVIQVLIATATLAWGVNLPAHTVIIKGTQVYSPEKGSWVELSPQDVLQMLGRAGRPQFDTYGEGCLITAGSEQLTYYMSLLQAQLPIESQMMSKLVDNLNAEIVLGNVRTRDEGVEWLGYTYLYVRMLRSPGLYSVGAEYEDDLALEQKRVDLIHSAATVLESVGLCKYDKRSGKLQATELGRVASHYYISHDSMRTYDQHITPSTSVIELFRVFALSKEFSLMPVRNDEKVELAKLLGRVPIPVKEGIEEPQAKINVLLQAYISMLKLEGLALMADMVYVTQSAGRILRAIFEIALRKGYAEVVKAALELCKTVERRMWSTMSPLRQFPSCPREIIQRTERISEIPWTSYFDLDPPRMGELLGLGPKAGRTVCGLVQKFPRLELGAQVQPLTRSLLRIQLTITPNFEWDPEVHGNAESFWIFVENEDGDKLLFADEFLLRREYAVGDAETTEHLVEFTVPISSDVMPPAYFISVISNKWLGSESKLAVSFSKLLLPERFPPHTQLLDLQPLPISALKVKEFSDLYKDRERFNKVQTQVFNSLYATDDNVFVGASPGNDNGVLSEFALLRHWAQSRPGRAVYLAPFQELVDLRCDEWQRRLSGLLGGKKIEKLTGETTQDLRLLADADLVLATPSQWDSISRQWQRRKNVQSVSLFIADYLHLVGGYNGYVYEVVVSRMHAMALQLESGMRIVGLSVSLSNARDLGEWIGAKKQTIFNFAPHHRAVPLEVHTQTFTVPHFPSLMLVMVKPMYQSILQNSPDKPAIVFVPNRKQVRATALDLLSACVSDDDEDRFLNASLDQLTPLLNKIGEAPLAESLSHGIGYYHEALSSFDKRAVKHLFRIGAIQVVLVSRDCCWEFDCQAHLVVIMGTQYYEGQTHRYLSYAIHEILQMLGKAGRVGEDKTSKGVLLMPAVKKDYYIKFLSEALPLESSLGSYLHDAFVSEISSGVITSTQDAVDWSTYTYWYRRLLANPSFYGLSDTSHEGLSAYLSESVETTLQELSEAKVIEVDEETDEITPLNAAQIAAYYNISFITMQTFLLSLNAKTRMKGLLEIVTSATEFEDIQIRRHEEQLLRRIYDRVPVKMSEVNYDSPHFKTFVLLQAHFSRIQLPVDLEKDQEIILKKILNLLSACVDVLGSDAHLNAMVAIEASQMVVQSCWNNDSPLKQLPHFDDRVVKVANAAGITDIFEFMEAMDPENPGYDKLVKSLGLNNKQLADVATFANEYYPNVDLSFELEDPEDLTAGSPAYISVTITRELEDDEEPKLEVHAPFYPGKKSESWYLVVGEEKSKSLLAIKRVTVGKQLKHKLEFTPAAPGKQTLTLYLMSDSYIGVDQAPTFEVNVAEGMDEDEEDEDEEAEDK